MDTHNLLIFAFLCIGGVILTYVVIITDKTRKMPTKTQTAQTLEKAVPFSIFFLLILYVFRLSLVTGTGLVFGIGIPVLIGILVALVPVSIACFFLIKQKKRGGKL